MKNSKVFPLWPYFGDEEISSVSRILRSGKVNQWTGREVINFEKEYARSLGAKYAVALANGSVALDIALLCLGIGPGDEVIVPARSFVASASCVALRKAIPVFADVDLESQNITVKNIEKVFSKRTRAVIAVHLAGWPCELDKIRDFCLRKKIYLIEDCAQAHGAKYRGMPAGSVGDIACFSFCQDKIISTGGEGGLLVTNNREIWKKAWSFKDHGRNYFSAICRKKSAGFNWAVSNFGSNYRMTEMQAAIGRLGLAKLKDWVVKRRKLAEILSNGFSRFNQLRVPIVPPGIQHSYYKYYVFVKPKYLKRGWDRNRIINVLNRKGIFCSTGSCPEIYLEEAFVKYLRVIRPMVRRLPAARELGETSVMFQVHPTLKIANMHHIIEEMDKVLGS